MAMIPFLDLHKVNARLEEEIRNAFSEVVNSGEYILGSQLRHFESMMADDLFSGKNEKGYVVGCNSGTDGITLALLAANVGFGDEVITVSHTALPTITAIVSVGAIPVFVDIDEKTWVMDVHRVADRISVKTKAIVPVHLYGNMVDVLKLKTFLRDCGREDIIIIEDAAQAQGSCLNGLQAGTIGDFGSYSFYPSKNLGALGDGGAIACKTELNYQRLCSLRNYGKKDRHLADLAHGLNSRLDEIQAGILSVKLKYLHEWNELKKQMMNLYKTELVDANISFQQSTENCNPAWHLCVLAFANQFERDNAMKVLVFNGVQTLIHYPVPAHKQQVFSQFANDSDDLINTEKLVERIISIPLNISLQKIEQEHIVRILKSL